MNLEIKQELLEGVYVLHLTGEVDAFTAPLLRDALMPLTEENGKKVIVDLTNVEYVDSTGLGILIGAYKSAHNYKSHLQLQGLSSRIKRLFEITGLDEIIDIKGNRGEYNGVSK